MKGMKRILSCGSQIECVTVSRDEKQEYYNEEVNYFKRGGDEKNKSNQDHRVTKIIDYRLL